MSHPHPPDSDGTVVEAVLCGRTDQFAEIARRYQSALLKAAQSRLGARDLAEDAVQETLLCAFKSLHTYDSRFSFRTWLWTILLNQCRRAYGKSQRRQETQAAVADSPPPVVNHATPATALLAKERAETLHRLLADLPEAQADALRLRFFGDLKFHEIAAAMDVSTSCAKHRVRCGLLALAQMMNEANVS